MFLNPVQEYNRDLSVVAIRTWSELRQQEKAKIWEKGVYKKWEKKRAKAQATAATSADPNHDASEPAGKKRKQDDGQAVPVTQDTTAANSTAEPEQTMDKVRFPDCGTVRICARNSLQMPHSRQVRQP